MSIERICEDCPIRKIGDVNAKAQAIRAASLVCRGYIAGCAVDGQGLTAEVTRYANECIEKQRESAEPYCLDGINRLNKGIKH